MSEIQPSGESLRRAVRYVSERLREKADQPLLPLVDEASRRFDLTPRESEYLIGFYRDALQHKQAEGGGDP